MVDVSKICALYSSYYSRFTLFQITSVNETSARWTLLLTWALSYLTCTWTNSQESFLTNNPFSQRIIFDVYCANPYCFVLYMNMTLEYRLIVFHNCKRAKINGIFEHGIFSDYFLSPLGLTLRFRRERIVIWHQKLGRFAH